MSILQELHARSTAIGGIGQPLQAQENHTAWILLKHCLTEKLMMTSMGRQNITLQLSLIQVLGRLLEKKMSLVSNAGE